VVQHDAARCSVSHLGKSVSHKSDVLRVEGVGRQALHGEGRMSEDVAYSTKCRVSECLMYSSA